MALEVFKYEDLSGVVQKLRFTSVWFTNQVPKRLINGITAQWDVVTPKIEIDRDFVTSGAASQAVSGTTLGTNHFTMPTSFKHVALNINEVANMRKLGQNVRDARGQDAVVREMQSLVRRYSAYLDEYLITQALTGTLTITVGGQSKAISYGIPAVNQINHGGAPWATATTQIPSQIAAAKARMVKSSGLQPKWLVANSTTLSYLAQNDFTSKYFGYAGTGGALKTGYPDAPFMGLSIVPVDGVYSSAGETEQFTTMFIPNNYVYILPDFAEGWIEMQVGLDNWVDGDGNAQEGWGPNSWMTLKDDPPSYLLYLRYTRCPVIMVPGAVIQLVVG